MVDVGAPFVNDLTQETKEIVNHPGSILNN